MRQTSLLLRSPLDWLSTAPPTSRYASGKAADGLQDRPAITSAFGPPQIGLPHAPALIPRSLRQPSLPPLQAAWAALEPGPAPAFTSA